MSSSLDDIRAFRVKKLEQLRNAGMDPYPARVDRDLSLKEVREQFSELERNEATIAIAGRIMAIRGQGAISFVVLYDGTATFQLVLKKDELDPELFQLWKDTIDIGDFVSARGSMFLTQKGEESILVKEWNIAAKSLLPLPEKWHGLQDADERYRKRYLDLLMDTDAHDMFLKKAKFWKVMRNFLEEQGFVEVHTPTLEITTGGAEARPFTTHHNDYDIDVHLRISIGELWQKRLMAAGYEKTYEIGRAYRNEGTSPNHLQEFTNMEFYWAYADYRMGMELVQDMYKRIAEEVFGTTSFTARGHHFDLADEWKEIDYCTEIKKQTDINILDTDENTLKKKLIELKVEFDATTKERLIDNLWKYCRKSISGPAFLVNIPTFMKPLAKRNESNPHTAEAFQVLLAGAELGNGYSELNDPQDQRERFEHQQKLLEAGDNEAMMADWDFVEMLEHGMPPTCGFGAGDRLFAFLVDKPIRETTLFPLMKPRS